MVRLFKFSEGDIHLPLILRDRTQHVRDPCAHSHQAPLLNFSISRLSFLVGLPSRVSFCVCALR